MSQTTKIVHITSVHPPHDQRILLKECTALVNAGYDVSYVVPHAADEMVNGVRIRAIPVARSRKERMFKSVWRVYRQSIKEDAVAYHFHDSELILVGLLLKLHGKRVVYDVHEDLPRQVLAKSWIPNLLRRPTAGVAGMVESVSARLFDGVVAATPVIAKRFPKHKTVSVQNFPISDEFEVADQVPYQQRENTVSHVGRIAETRGAYEIVDSMAHVEPRFDATLVLAGKFIPPLTEPDVDQRPGWKSINFIGWQDRAAVAELLGRTRVGLVIMRPIRQYIESQPTKLFEYMAAGVPVVAADFPIWRTFVEDAGCGLVVDPLDPKAIANAVMWLLDHPAEAEAMGQRGKEAIASKVNWENEARILSGFYQDVVLT